MSKPIKIGGIVLIVTFYIYFIAKILGVIQIFETPSIANLPSLKLEGWHYATNLKTVKRLDYICFNQINPDFEQSTWVQRVVGIEGDCIEMRNGVLFVNDKNIDDSIVTLHNFIVDINLLPRIQKELNLDVSSVVNMIDSCMISVTKEQVQPYMNVRTYHNDFQNEYLSDLFKPSWSVNNFGPIVVPKNMFFVLGNNRDNSIDSRHFGFIKKENVTGVLF